MGIRHLIALGLGTLTVLGGCAGDGSSDESTSAGVGMTVRDSAGVRIVENGETPTAGWAVAPEPLFRVGWDEGGLLLTWAQSGRILPGGGALIAEQSNGTIYRLGPDGAVLDSVGRRGEGPGEFERMDGMALKGDSIVVSDLRLRRITFLAQDGGARTVRLPDNTQAPTLSAVTSDGRVLVVAGEGYGGPPAGQSGWMFQEEPILLADTDTGQLDTLAVLPHLRLWYGDRAPTPGPLWNKGRAGGHADGFAWARSDQPAVRWYDWDGRLLQIARWDEAAVELDAERRDLLLDGYRSAWADNDWDTPMINRQLAELEAGLDRYDLPIPIWDQLHVDRGGNVWLSDYPRPFQASESWRVIARDGTLAAEIEIPGVIRVLDITDDRVLGVVMNDLNVPAVVMLAIEKP